MEERLRDFADHVLIVGGLTMAAVGILGEILGWWGELGLVLTIGGLLSGIVGLLDVNGRKLLGLVGPLIGSIEGLHTKVDGLGANQERMLTNQERMLTNQQRMLDKHDEAIDQLVRVGDLLDDRLPS